MPKTQLPNDLEFMQDDGRWPNWPLLPVKRPTRTPGTMPETCLMVAFAEYRTQVFKLNLFHMPRGPKTWRELLDATESYDYDSLEAVVADGWIVD